MGEIAERPQPQDLDAEVGVIGSLMLDPQWVGKVFTGDIRGRAVDRFENAQACFI